MKSSKLSEVARIARRETIMSKRAATRAAVSYPGRRAYIQYGCTHFAQHCGASQQARYTRQLAAGQIAFIEHGPRKPVEPVVKKTRKPRAKKVDAA